MFSANNWKAKHILHLISFQATKHKNRHFKQVKNQHLFRVKDFSQGNLKCSMVPSAYRVKGSLSNVDMTTDCAFQTAQTAFLHAQKKTDKGRKPEVLIVQSL